MEYNVNRFKELLLEENQKQNLISRRNPDMEIDKHIEDSRRVMDFYQFAGKRVIDVGSGAGFPGLILAILVGEGKYALIESDLKKSGFLFQIARELQLENVEIINQRAEIVGKDSQYRASFDYCTSRAVASIRIILEYSLPLITLGGRVIMWKGRNYRPELEEARQALNILGGELETVYDYNLMGELDRTLVVVKKIRETPEKYPRRNGVPGKRPL